MNARLPQLVTDSFDTIDGFVFDAGTIDKVEITDAGFVRAPARITRAGVFVYRNADGSERRELRLPDEVFAEDSLKTLMLVPLTREHPEPIGTPVTVDNRKQLDVGVVGSDVRRDGDHVMASIQVEDAGAIDDIRSGRRRELSAGYNRRLDLTPGEWHGIRYDGIQRQIRYNHVALTVSGRAGPDTRIRLDSNAAVMVCDASEDHKPSTGGATPMKRKIIVDGITYEIDCEDSTLAVITKAIADRDAKLGAVDSKIADLAKERDQEKARADTAEAELKKTKELVADSTKPGKVAELVKARLELERTVKPLLVDAKGQEPDLSGVAEDEIMRRVILVHDSDAKFDGVSPEYLKARYDASLVELKKRSAAGATNDALRRATGVTPVTTDATRPGKTEVSAEDSRRKLREESQDAWQKPLGHQPPAQS